MRILRMAALCACVILVTSDLRAQQQIIINGPADMPVQLPGMGPRQPKTGTARLRGRVVSTDTGGPVRRAQVRIAGPGYRLQERDDRRRRPLRVPRSAGGTLQCDGEQGRISSASSTGRRGRSSRASRSTDRRPGARQSRYLDAARQRDLRAGGRRVRRSDGGRDRQCDAIGVVRRTSAASADWPHGA